MRQAYDQCLRLNLTTCRSLLAESNSPEAFYISSLADVLELLITEDKSKFPLYEAEHEKRINALKKISPATERSLFALAELRLQWAFVYLKFGHDFTAAWNVRQAHVIATECRKKFPGSIPIQKTSGILNVMLGSVPEKYQWILGLLGMKGSVEVGLTELEVVERQSKHLAFEAALLRLLIDGFILQETDSALAGIENVHFENPNNRLILFLGASLAIKSSLSEVAMNMLDKLKNLPDHGLPIYYSDYLLGEVYLHQGNYSKSIQAFESFTERYKGENFVKDAYYKIGVAHWLSHRSESAFRYFDLARTKGKEASEADKYAARVLAENTLPNIKLARIRYSTDGGYYNEAFRLAKSITSEELHTTRDLTEYHYRFARLLHKSGNLEDARKYYLQAIELNAQENWYYAPNACLQLGYIYAHENQVEEARKYFFKALSYKKHAYKNSIDSKAKSALEHLKKNQ
jgi:tetratricopeptide (TPR) repeat protein